MGFDYDALLSAVEGKAVAIRSIARLQPAGGPGDKVFPPTYVKEGRAETKYAMERRLVDGREVNTVLLDSVASQANRMEEALLQGWRDRELDFPLVQVDFTGEADLADLGSISALQTPHRIADALLRDSLLDGTLFRYTPVGKAFTDSRPGNATGMFLHCPTALLFGVWDSTGPKGGLGAKFQRCMVSEIVGIDAVAGVKTASRIDPLGIEKKAGPVYRHKDEMERWTTDENEAVKEKGKPMLMGGKGADGKGSPAAINHGNIPPSIDSEAGGVTMSHAIQTTVLSLAGLRRLFFVTNSEGSAFPEKERKAVELAARTSIAALGLAGMVYLRENDYDLRSRSLLVATEQQKFEMLGRNGEPAEEFNLTRQEAAELLRVSQKKAAEAGLGWERGPVDLKPAPKLADLIRRSRSLLIAGEGEDE